MTVTGDTVAGYLQGDYNFEDIDDTEFTDPLMKDFSFEGSTLTYDLSESPRSLEAVEQAEQIFDSAIEAADYIDERLWDTVKAIEASVSRQLEPEFSLRTVTEEQENYFGPKKIFNKDGYGETFMAEVADEFRHAVERQGYQEIASNMPQYE